MRGHVYRRGDTWTVVVYVNHPETGKPRHKSYGGFRTRRDAERARADLVSKINRGEYAEPTKMTLSEYLIEKWLPAAGTTRKPSTLVGYRIVIEKHIVPRLGDVPLVRLSAADLDGLYAELAKSGHRQREAGLGARSVRLVHSVLRRALADAVRWQLISRNVADQATPPSAGAANADAEKKRKWWSAEELGTFLEHVRDDRLFAAYWLATVTGVRRGELLGLRWRDVDFENARLHVRQSLIAPKYELQFSSPKSGKARAIDLAPETLAVLRAHSRRQAEEKLAYGAGWGVHPLGDDLVFRDETGAPVKPALFSLAFASRVNAAGVTKIRFHDVRHTCATLLAQGGAHPVVVQKILGHATPGFTLSFYTHAFPSQQREAVERFASLVSGHGSPSLASF